MKATGIDWHTLSSYLFPPDRATIDALIMTLSCAVAAQFLGTAIGLISALMQRSSHHPLRWLAAVYVWSMRGTPLIVQIFFIYYGANLLLGVDLIPRRIDLLTFSINGAVVSGIAALAINEGAYMSEIIRAGIASIDTGQMEAAQVLGMTRGMAMRRIVLPEAARVILPPLGNEFNSMLKSTSMLSFIGITELFNDAQQRYSATFRPVEYFLGVAILYLSLTTVWSFVQGKIEARLNVAYSSKRGPSGSYFRRVFGGSVADR
jgi:polar amino acid transport system permease protein